MVSLNSDVEVTKDDKLVHPGHGCYGVLQILTESVLSLVRVGHGGAQELINVVNFFLDVVRQAVIRQLLIPLGKHPLC